MRLRSILKNKLSDALEVRLHVAALRLKARDFVSVVDKCTTVIDGTLASDEQRLAALMMRGKAYLSLRLPVASAYDFYKVLEKENNNSEAFGYICQIAADYDLPLLKEK
jgi:hypothetical protein